MENSLELSNGECVFISSTQLNHFLLCVRLCFPLLNLSIWPYGWLPYWSIELPLATVGEKNELDRTKESERERERERKKKRSLLDWRTKATAETNWSRTLNEISLDLMQLTMASINLYTCVGVCVCVWCLPPVGKKTWWVKVSISM